MAAPSDQDVRDVLAELAGELFMAANRAPTMAQREASRTRARELVRRIRELDRHEDAFMLAGREEGRA